MLWLWKSYRHKGKGFAVCNDGIILKSEGLLEKILPGYFKYHRSHYNVTDIAQSQIKVSLYVTLWS